MPTLAARVAKLFGVTPTGRYARYLATAEWTKLDGRRAPAPYAREVMIGPESMKETQEISGAVTAGFTLAYYVPFFDLN